MLMIILVEDGVSYGNQKNNARPVPGVKLEEIKRALRLCGRAAAKAGGHMGATPQWAGGGSKAATPRISPRPAPCRADLSKIRDRIKIAPRPLRSRRAHSPGTGAPKGAAAGLRPAFRPEGS